MVAKLPWARSIVSETLTAPAQLHAKYASFITRNSSSVSQIESTLRSLTYLLPSTGSTPGPQLDNAASEKRVSKIRALLSTELAPELIYSFTQLLSLYHNDILRRSLAVLPPSRRPKSPPHARYTNYWTKRSSLYSRFATLLQCIQYTELLWEMVAKRRGGEKSRWRVVVFLESMKAIVRLIIMPLTNGRPVVNPPVPEREEPLPAPVDDDDISPEALQEAELNAWTEEAQEAEAIVHPLANGNTKANGNLTKHPLGDESPLINPATPQSETTTTSTNSLAQPYQMPRTSLTIEPLPASSSNVLSYLLSRVIDPTELKPAKQLLVTLSSSTAQAAEILYILRPVVYVLILQRLASKYGTQKARTDWRPWLIGVAMEYASFRLNSLAKSKSPALYTSLATNTLESEETRKRQTAALWWLLRGAAWEGLTKRWVNGVSSRLKRWPLLDLLGGVVEEYEFLWGEYHFATANS
ncbi:MAG: hypothetical protein Q9160_005311 [Pyrenula sp. 1 TL-2023]